jgi:hypothetical protein
MSATIFACMAISFLTLHPFVHHPSPSNRGCFSLSNGAGTPTVAVFIASEV